MKIAFSLAALAATFLLSHSVCGQSALDGFEPNANGAILAVAVQPDSKILIGGDFVARNRIARLNVDNTSLNFPKERVRNRNKEKK